MSDEKQLKELTPEIEAKIPSYIAKAVEGVFDGKRFKAFDPGKALDAVDWNYVECSYKPPIMLVCSNPYEQQLMLNMMILLDNEGVVPYKNEREKEALIMLATSALVQLDKFDVKGRHEKFRDGMLKLLQNTVNGKTLKKSDKVDDLYIYNNMHLITLNVNSDSYYQWYEFLRNEFDLKLDINDKFQECFRLQRESCVYSAVYAEEVCIVCKYPKMVHRDEAKALHNPSGPAVDWESASGVPFWCYYVHGRNFSKELFDKVWNGKLTRKEFTDEPNEDQKGIMYSIMEAKREGGMMKFLGAKLFHEETLVHKSGRVENVKLYRTKETFPELQDRNGNRNVPLCWLQMQCPTTGTDYLVSTDPTFKTAGEAMRFHRPEEIPFEHPYNWASAN